MKKETREKLLVCLVVWPALAALIAGSIWGLILFTRACDWFFGELRQLKLDYVTPCEQEWGVVLCAATCVLCLLFYRFLGKVKSNHGAAAVDHASGIILGPGLCWMVYLFSSQHMTFWLMVKCFSWTLLLGLIGGGLEKSWKICYVAFWLMLLFSVNEHFVLFQAFSITGLKPEEKNFLDYHFGLTQIIMLSFAGVLLATPSAFKWIWFEAEQERVRIMKEIFASFNRAESPLHDTESARPDSKDVASQSPAKE